MAHADQLIRKAEQREILFGWSAWATSACRSAVELVARRLPGAGVRHQRARSWRGSMRGGRTSRTSPTRSSRRRSWSGRFGATTDPVAPRRAGRDLDLRADAALQVQGSGRELHRRRHRGGEGARSGRARRSCSRAPRIPGTTREVMLPALEETGLKVGEDFFLAFSPERVDPGNATWHTRNTPKVVGGITADCTRVVAAPVPAGDRDARAGLVAPKPPSWSSCWRTPSAA